MCNPRRIESARQDSGTRPADVVVDGYGALRRTMGRGPAWFASLAAPALRLHRYRSASNRVWRHAICRNDCPDGPRS